MRARVDVGSLAELANAVGVVEGRLREGTTDATAALHTEPGRTSAAPLLLLAVLARDRTLADLAALRTVVALAAESYAATEERVGQLIASCPGGAVRALLGGVGPVGLEHLLMAAPALVGSALLGSGGRSAAGVGLARTSWGSTGSGSTGSAMGDEALSIELTRTLLLPAAAAAELQARLLQALDPARRRVFALLHPRLFGALAGAPASDRFAASRVLVAADLARLTRERFAAPPGSARNALDRRIAVRQELVAGEVVLAHPDGTTSRRPHQLLSFDPTGDGRIVEVLGDLSRAQHLAVFVPGTGSDLARYPGSLQRMTPFAAAEPDLAVVLWQNADHPDQPFDEPPFHDLPFDRGRSGDQRPVGSPSGDPLLPVLGLPALPVTLAEYSRTHVLAAAFRDSAVRAGPVLAADVAGLRVAEPRAAADLTVLGHSYGGSIVGAAETHGMLANRVVHVASAGAFVDDVREYASPTGPQRFSMTAYDDPIQLSQGYDATEAADRLRDMLPAPLDPVVPLAARAALLAVGGGDEVGHGLDPDELPGVVRLDTGVHSDGSLVRGHSAMFKPGSTAWRNLLAVMTHGEVAVLQPQLWASHLEPLGAEITLPGGASAGGTTMRPLPPRFVIDRTPYADPGYRPPLLDLG